MKTPILRRQFPAAVGYCVLWFGLLFGFASVSHAQLTTNFYGSFETQSDLDNWSVDNGTWEIGIPTYGPPPNPSGRRAFAGTNCAATILGGDYAEDHSSRLVSPSFLVPPAASNPRLRFWHWYSWGAHDFGAVQIKVGTNAWQDLGASYTATSGGIWTRPSLDLSAYAGRTVQLAFYFESHNNFFGSTVGSGWYVDEVTVITGPETLNNPETWEGGLGDWFAETGTWEVGTPISGPGTAHQGTNCAATILGGDYAEDHSSRLVSPSFLVPPAASNPRLRFWHWYSWGAHDFGAVQIKVGTNAWQDLGASYTATSGGIWTRPSLDLSAYAGRTVQLAFYFESHNNFFGSTVGPGWYVDEVQLIHDAALLVGSTILRTQDTACVSLEMAASGVPKTASFTLPARPTAPQGTAFGSLSNLVLNAEGCWSVVSFIPQPNSQWSVVLSNSCTTTPMGVTKIGSLCFTAVSTQSGFAPLVLTSLAVTNQDATLSIARAFPGRAVIIGDQPLLESWYGTGGQRMVTTYGKPNTGYVIRYATSVTNTSPWTLSDITNLIPASMFYSQPLTGVPSNAPIVFLRADER